MDELPPLLKLASNPWLLLLFLVLLIVLFHLLLITVFKLGKIGWKRTEYVWLGLASLSLLSVAAESRIWLANNRLQTAIDRTRFTLKDIRRNLVTSPPTYFCIKFNRTEFARPDFDEVQRQFDAACEWLKSAPAVLPPTDEPPFRKLSFEDTNFPSSINDEVILQTINSIRLMFSEYESRRTALEEMQFATKRTGGEDMNFVFAPIFAVLALALRITKVTGEIRLERNTK